MNEYEKTEEEQAQLGQSSGAKFDKNKSRWDLIPADVVLEVAQEFGTFKGLYDMEAKIKGWEGKMLFHYSNGMEATWNFWGRKKETPFSSGVKDPLVFAIISYIHLVDLALIFEEDERDRLLSDRTSLYETEVPNTSAFYLIPYKVINYLGDIYLYGSKKYDENNWRKGIPYGKIFAAFCRHSGQWHGGEVFDGESGMHHLGHALWQLFCLRWYEQHTPENDDRWVNVEVNKK